MLSVKMLSVVRSKVFKDGIIPFVINKKNFLGNNFYQTKNLITTKRKYSSPSRLILTNDKILKSSLPKLVDYSGEFLHDNIYKNIDKWWNKTALICSLTGRSYTYKQLKLLSGRLATSFVKNKLHPGDTIALILPNIPEYAIILLAASQAGLKVTLINPIYTAEEIKKQLKNSETVGVITVPSRYETVNSSIQVESIRLPLILINDGNNPTQVNNTINFFDLLSDDIEEFDKTDGFKHLKCNPTLDTFLLPYSSGTTGLPKGVELTHKNLVVNIWQLSHPEVTTAVEATEDHQEIVPVFLPFYHIYGLVICMFNYLSLGAKVVCMPQFSSNELLNVFENHQITSLYVAPPVFHLLVNDSKFHKKHLQSVKIMMCAAASLSEELVSKFLSRFGNVNLIQGYGLTETSPAICKSRGQAPLNSVGFLLQNTEVRIVGDGENNLKKNLNVNEIGELYIRGPQVMKGYYKNKEATENCMENDWFKTGDLASFDQDGHLYIHGRLKELIKVQGFQVSPSELEDLMLGNEHVLDVGIVGALHEKYGEIPVAFVVPRTDKVTEDDIKDFVSKNVAKYKQLDRVIFVDKIPKSAAGKILRRELAKML